MTRRSRWRGVQAGRVRKPVAAGTAVLAPTTATACSEEEDDGIVEEVEEVDEAEEDLRLSPARPAA